MQTTDREVKGDAQPELGVDTEQPRPPLRQDDIRKNLLR